VDTVQREVEERANFKISDLLDDYLILSLGADELAIKPLKLYGREMLTLIGLKRAAGER